MYFFCTLIFCSVFFLSVFAFYFLKDLPSINTLDEYVPSLSTYLYDINGDIITEFSVERRTFIELERIPKDIINALLAMEDTDFYSHWGISFKGITRAFVNFIVHRKIKGGGSTITQQLSKLIFLKPERTISRKIKEMIIALQIEHNFSKEEILQMYFNQIYFGIGAYGISTAAKIYFGKRVEDLTLAECALLIGIIPAPERYSPFNNPELAKLRRNLVLERMFEEGFITQDELNDAKNIKLPEKKSILYPSRAPYFSEFIRQQLEPKYGVETFWKRGLKIYSTLDLKMQLKAEEIFEKNLSEFESKKTLVNSEDFDSLSTSTLQGAFMLVESRTGAIKVMIGGRNYQQSQFNRAVQAKRQAGSTFKPFIWYAALQYGLTPQSRIYDRPMVFFSDSKMQWHLIEDATDQAAIDEAIEPFAGNPEFKIWTPSNFDNKYLGEISLRKALEKSRNLSSVYLINLVGIQNVVDVAKRCGIKSKLDAVPSLSLGTSLVSLMEMVYAFNTFTNEGIYTEPLYILKVTDNEGRILEETFPRENEVLNPQITYLLLNIMKGVVQRGTAKIVSEIKKPIAGKTGTSQDSKDMWFIGMTPDFTAGGWMGYDDFSRIPSSDWTGGTTVAKWWAEIMKEILKDYPAKDFSVPDGITFVRVDDESGKLAGPKCKEKILEAFIKGTEPKEFCQIHE
ncbi:MAG: PBP1A family penicillin-binding protein [Elusimicrobiales bacterium]|nr:PBP1A family penicillin-binding protein [Elusimicrobiales bacterium]